MAEDMSEKTFLILKRHTISSAGSFSKNHLQDENILFFVF